MKQIERKIFVLMGLYGDEWRRIAQLERRADADKAQERINEYRHQMEMPELEMRVQEC